MVHGLGGLYPEVGFAVYDLELALQLLDSPRPPKVGRNGPKPVQQGYFSTYFGCPGSYSLNSCYPPL